jgi:hypothetical protein
MSLATNAADVKIYLPFGPNVVGVVIVERSGRGWIFFVEEFAGNYVPGVVVLRVRWREYS